MTNSVLDRSPHRPTATGIRSSAASLARARSRRLSPNVSFYLLASLVVSFLAASSAPTPLYAVYQATWGFSPITTTVVFGIYALAVLLALLSFGKLSDHLGRRPILLGALAGQSASMLVFATADGVPALMAARVIQGIATGAALGAIGAGMIDINRERGTVANSVVPGIGTGSGAIVSALVVQYLPAPTRVIYLALLGVFALQALGILVMPETVTRKAGALATLVPEITLPKAVRPTAFVAIPVLFILAGVAAASVALLRNAPARSVMLIGIGALVAGVAGSLVAIGTGSGTEFFLATAVAGVGFGSGFQGAIRTVIPLAHPHERAGVLSLLYVVSYLGMGAPAVAAGYLVVHEGGLLDVAREYSFFVIALALLALVGLLRSVRVERATAAAEIAPAGASWQQLNQGFQR